MTILYMVQQYIRLVAMKQLSNRERSQKSEYKNIGEDFIISNSEQKNNSHYSLKS